MVPGGELGVGRGLADRRGRRRRRRPGRGLEATGVDIAPALRRVLEPDLTQRVLHRPVGGGDFYAPHRRRAAPRHAAARGGIFWRRAASVVMIRSVPAHLW